MMLLPPPHAKNPPLLSCQLDNSKPFNVGSSENENLDFVFKQSLLKVKETLKN